MLSKFSTRREFLNYGKLSLLFLLNSCSNLPNKVNIAFQNSFYPKSFKDTIPKEWGQKKINFENIQLQKIRNTLLESDFSLINDDHVRVECVDWSKKISNKNNWQDNLVVGAVSTEISLWIKSGYN